MNYRNDDLSEREITHPQTKWQLFGFMAISGLFAKHSDCWFEIYFQSKMLKTFWTVTNLY